MATFRLFFQSVRAKDLSAPLYVTRFALEEAPCYWTVCTFCAVCNHSSLTFIILLEQGSVLVGYVCIKHDDQFWHGEKGCFFFYFSLLLQYVVVKTVKKL